ncbi:ATP-binding protein [Nonomuraea zeae]|uniref:ATP-binding protein n=1 Tax=Nonomuraea zeae TaxID=1642303 RepID=A0A5S4GX20_9ACTN|nr:ATP-binding protein [Nonomuraea zeae]TMR37061.1 ATP-binding protein [Nonomuraea zeae]
MADYPPRNPFPARGISTAEETSRPDFLNDWARQIPTVVLPGVRGALRLAETYLRGFPGDGGLSCLWGAHGIGKTHAARHMMAYVNGEDSQAIQLYLRFQDDDFVAAYRSLVAQLPRELLADLSLSYRAALKGDLTARAAHGAGGDDQLIGKERVRVLDVIEDGEVLEEQAKEIAAVAVDWPQFQRALDYLIRPDFSDAAYDWLCGRPITPDAAGAIGVSEQIDDPLTCRYGLQLLTTLVTRGGRSFVVVLDQCEKFLLMDGDPVPANIGLLQGLVEVVPQARGLLVLVTSEAGWHGMPPDLRQRIGAGACHLLPLTPDEARQVLAAYIGATRRTPSEGIWPFTESGLLELLRHSGGNIRLLLQLAWAGFEAARPPSPIEAEQVAAASTQDSRAPGLPSVAMLVDSELRAMGLSAERVEERDRITSFHVPGARNPRAVIRLSEAMFYDDEASNAAELVGSGARSAFTALVVTGYVSPPVLTVLRGAMHEVLVADGSAAFVRRLHGLVERIAAMPGQAGQPAVLDSTLRELQAQLDGLNSERRREADALRRELAELSERLEREQQRTRPDWPARRATLVARIDEARAARAAADWEEFRKSRADVVRGRSVTLGWLAGLAIATVALLSIALLNSMPLTAVLVAAAVATAAGGVLLGRRLLSIKVNRPGASLESARDLDRLAREAQADPLSPDPVGRYAHALQGDPDNAFSPLLESMLEEPLALIRQAMARRLADTARPPSRCVPEVLRGLHAGVPEVLLLLARGQRHAESDRQPRALRDLPPELRVLVALANPAALRLAGGAVSTQPAELALEALGVRGHRHPLALAFRDGVAQTVTVEIPAGEIPAGALRATAQLLSPLHRDGLGTYDWLPVITKIDELYLFFEELLYFHEENAANRH